MTKKYYDDEAIEKSRHIDFKDYPKSMPTHKSVKEILQSCYWREHRGDITIDQTLKALTELIRDEKRGVKYWDECCEHIAQLVEGKE